MVCIGMHKHLNLNKVHCFQCVCAYIPKQVSIHTRILATSILVFISYILVLVPTPIYHY